MRDRDDRNGHDKRDRGRRYSSDDQDWQSDPGYDSYDPPPRRRNSHRDRDGDRDRPRQKSRVRAAYYDESESDFDGPQRRRQNQRPGTREAYWEGDKYVTKEWDEDQYFTNDGRKVQTKELVVRKRTGDPDRDDSIEDIPRDFPPPSRPGFARRTTSLDREDTLYSGRRSVARRRGKDP